MKSKFQEERKYYEKYEWMEHIYKRRIKEFG